MKLLVRILLIIIVTLASCSYFMWAYEEVGLSITYTNVLAWAFIIAAWLACIWIVMLVYEMSKG